MNNKKYLDKIIICLLACTIVASTPYAQGDTTDATTELLKLQAVFENASYVSFNVAYYYEEDDTTGIKRDTLLGTYRVNKDKYYYILDSVEQIQNEQYLITIDKDNEVIYMQRPYASYASVLQSKLMDSVFRNYYVDSMPVIDSGAYRIIKIQFKPEAVYTDYQMVYDTSGLRPATLKYTIKKEVSQNPSFQQFIRVKIVFNNFQTGLFDDSIFNIDAIVVRQNGKFVINPTSYASYSLANMYDEQ